LVLEKVKGWKVERKESLLKNGLPSFGLFVREDVKA
jgi:hypothetical protein